VGYYSSDAQTFNTLVLHYDGRSWSQAPTSRSPEGSGSQLNAVACPTMTSCWAVGYSWTLTGNSPTSVGSAPVTLIEHFDGRNWYAASSPNFPVSTATAFGGDSLYGVSCVSERDCWAVGYYWTQCTGFAPCTGGALIEHYDGTAWSVLTEPLTTAGQAENGLMAVSCVDTSDCWAVGQDALAHYNGDRWDTVPAPVTAATELDLLTGVACAAANNCWAVGSRQSVSPFDQELITTLVEHYDGQSWTVEASPNPGMWSSLSTLSCTNAQHCWAVGFDLLTDSNGQYYVGALIEHLAGANWTISEAADTGSGGTLRGVSCPAANECWAVGEISTSWDSGTTLTEHYLEAVPTVVQSDSNPGAVGGAASGDHRTPSATRQTPSAGQLIGGTTQSASAKTPGTVMSRATRSTDGGTTVVDRPQGYRGLGEAASPLLPPIPKSDGSSPSAAAIAMAVIMSVALAFWAYNYRRRNQYLARVGMTIDRDPLH
jgi:hypothetical protein